MKKTNTHTHTKNKRIRPLQKKGALFKSFSKETQTSVFQAINFQVRLLLVFGIDPLGFQKAFFGSWKNQPESKIDHCQSLKVGVGVKILVKSANYPQERIIWIRS